MIKRIATVLLATSLLACMPAAADKPVSVHKDGTKPMPMITIDGSKFVADGKEFKIWGFNQGRGTNLTDKQLDRIVGQLEFLGVNMLRLHSIDWTLWGDWNGPSGLLPTGANRKDTQHLVGVKGFYRLMNRLRKSKIYVAITLSVCHDYVPADVDILQTTPQDRKAWMKAIKDLKSNLHNYKTLPVIDERSCALRKKWASNLLNLKNPQTGVRMAEDPQLALLNIINEGSSWSTFYRNNWDEALPEYFKRKFRKRWNNWLKKKYGTDAKLAAAWKPLRLEVEKNKKGLLPNESLFKGTIKDLPRDTIHLSKERQLNRTYEYFSAARQKDYVRFLWELDANHMRMMQKYFESLGFNRPASYCDGVGIGGATGAYWMKSDVFPYVEDHPYDEANIDLYNWGWLRIPKYAGATFLGPEGAGRPHWGSEIRAGSGWVSWTRIPFPLFVAAYHSLQGRDGVTWHVWAMSRQYALENDLMYNKLTWCHCNWDVPWLFVYRAAGRLFKSCEIKPLPLGHEALKRFWDWESQVNITNKQVSRRTGIGNSLLTVNTEHFKAITVPRPHKQTFGNITIDLKSKTNNVVIVEKINRDFYEVTAVGTSGGMQKGKSIMFKPLQYVYGSVAFRGRIVKAVEHIDHYGRIVEKVSGHGAKMVFVPGVRLYRVYLK